MHQNQYQKVKNKLHAFTSLGLGGWVAGLTTPRTFSSKLNSVIRRRYSSFIKLTVSCTISAVRSELHQCIHVKEGLAPPERLQPGLDRPPRRGTFEPLVASPLGSVADPLGDLGCLSGDSLDMISGPRTGGTVAEQLRRLMEPGSGSQSTRSPPTNRKP